MTGYHSPAGVTNSCPSGKRTWPKRSQAKAAALKLRQFYGEHLRPYRCLDCDQWHIGHLPREVLRGHKTARDIFGERPAS